VSDLMMNGDAGAALGERDGDFLLDAALGLDRLDQADRIISFYLELNRTAIGRVSSWHSLWRRPEPVAAPRLPITQFSLGYRLRKLSEHILAANKTVPDDSRADIRGHYDFYRSIGQPVAVGLAEIRHLFYFDGCAVVCLYDKRDAQQAGTRVD